MKIFLIGLVCLVSLIVATLVHQSVVEYLFGKEIFTLRIMMLSLGCSLVTTSVFFVIGTCVVGWLNIKLVSPQDRL